MKRETAIKKLMSIGASRNYANQYLDDVHEWAKLNNSESIIQYIFDNALSPYTSSIILRKEKMK